MFPGYNPRMEDTRPLTLAQEQFCQALVSDPARVVTTAYERVYTARGHSATVGGHKLMKDPRIAARIAELESGVRQRAHLTVDLVLQHVAELATADPRDLTEYRRGACRYCHGIGHRYQRRPQEFRDAFAAYLRTPKGAEDPAGVFFDYLGGLGFNVNAPPHPDCPECNGNGVGYTYARDLRTVSPAAARLFAGIKETRDGFEIKTRSQDKAIELAMKHLGLLRDKDADENSEIPPAGTVTFEVEDASGPPDA